MPIEVTARHMNAGDELLDYARDRGQEIADEFPRVEHVHMIVDHEKRRQIAHVVVQARNHIRLEAEEETENMRASIDQAVEKVTRQLRRLRDKVQDHKPAMKHEEALHNGAVEAGEETEEEEAE